MFPVFWSFMLFIETLFLIVILSCGMNKRHLKKTFTQEMKNAEMLYKRISFLFTWY